MMIAIKDAYIYCPSCKSQLEAKHDFKQCPNCFRHYYFDPNPTVGILLTNSDDEILFVKRASDPFKGWWDLPGGFVEQSENLEMAARRELFEETGLKVDDLMYIGSVAEHYDYRDVRHSNVGAVFRGKIPNDCVIQVGDDVNDYEFLAKDKIDFSKIAFEKQRSFLKTLLA